MAASRDDIQRWFERGVGQEATHMVVVCDTFDYEDYPVFVTASEDVEEKLLNYRGNMQRVMEVYKLSDDMEEQLSQHRVWNI